MIGAPVQIVRDEVDRACSRLGRGGMRWVHSAAEADALRQIKQRRAGGRAECNADAAP